MKPQIGQSYIMPKPQADDAWHFSGFAARITDILETGMAIVEDQDSDFFTIELDRLTKCERAD